MNDYEPYGPEWEKEMMKWSKKMLIDWIRTMLMQAQTKPDEPQIVTTGGSWPPTDPNVPSSQ